MTNPNDVIAVIPAYNPDETLLRLVDVLGGHLPVVVVDDGSREASIFERLPATVTVLTHTDNCGKGAALKTAFRHIFEHYPDAVGVVTLDADGQHLPEDVLKVVRRLRECPSSLTFGVRRFEGDVPLRNRLGNLITRLVVRVFLRIHLSDTQTGLRGIPRELLPVALDVPFNRYEFEAEMLCRVKEFGVTFEEVVIHTVYFPHASRRSHFLPVIDSMRIYWALFRHVFAGLAAVVVDFGVYLIALFLSGQVLASVCAGRLSSLLFNFLLVKRFVFRSRNGGRREFLLYLLQVAVMAVVTAQLITVASDVFDLHPAVLKIPIDILVYPLNFLLQRNVIFRASSKFKSSTRAPFHRP